jgi:hypothetical protein
MNFEENIQLHALKLKATVSGQGGRLLDQLLDQTDSPQVRQMCAKVSSALYDDLESVCGLLDMSKREFIESAVADALQRAHEVINSTGVMESIEQAGNR